MIEQKAYYEPPRDLDDDNDEDLEECDHCGGKAKCKPENLGGKMEYQAGDKVKCAFFGEEVFELKGIKAEKCAGIYFPLYFEYNNANHYFTTDGKDSLKHTHPILTLVERPKKKKIKLDFWVNVYDDGVCCLSHTKDRADMVAGEDIIACEHFERIIEVEE